MVPSIPPRFPWQAAYDDALGENNTFHLFRRVEIAESTIRIRLDTLADAARHDLERDAILEALATLMTIKVDRLGFIPPLESL